MVSNGFKMLNFGGLVWLSAYMKHLAAPNAPPTEIMRPRSMRAAPHVPLMSASDPYPT